MILVLKYPKVGWIINFCRQKNELFNDNDSEFFPKLFLIPTQNMTSAAGGYENNFYVYIVKTKLCQLLGATVEPNQIKKAKK